MKELLTYLVQSLVDHPDEVSVTERKVDGETIFDGDELASFFKQALSDLFNVKNTAIVNIGKDAVIYSEGDIDISVAARRKLFLTYLH